MTLTKKLYFNKLSQTACINFLTN